ncbi:MAG TPA: hypothetical protein EYP04_04995 [Anaerolineae bacterium]|nr:hypothetical protein [Anaerolineae bacterium]
MAEKSVSTSEEPLEEWHALTFADGFQFGCGFIAAVTLGLLILLLSVALIALILSLMGVGVLKDIFGLGYQLPAW